MMGTYMRYVYHRAAAEAEDRRAVELARQKKEDASNRESVWGMLAKSQLQLSEFSGLTGWVAVVMYPGTETPLFLARDATGQPHFSAISSGSRLEVFTHRQNALDAVYCIFDSPKRGNPICGKPKALKRLQKVAALKIK